MKVRELSRDGKGKLSVEVTVEPEKVDRALDTVYRKVAMEVNIPGFRRGKTPKKILVARVGQELFNSEARELLVNDGFEQAIKEFGIEPLGVDIGDTQVEPGKQFIFTLDIEIPPDVELKRYKGVPVPRVPEAATEEMIQAEIDTLRDRYANLEPCDGKLENGMFAIIDYTSTMDGEPFKGGSAEGSLVEVGGGSLLPGFEENLKGLEKGGEKTFDLIFPDDYHHEEVRGKTAVFTVMVKEVKKKNLPEADDSFAKELGKFETMAELREDIKKRLDERLKLMSRRTYEHHVIERIATESEVNPPEKLVSRKLDEEMEDQEKAFRMRFADGDFDAYLAWKGTNRDGLKEELKPRAEIQARAEMVLSAVIKAEGIAVTAEEENTEIGEMAGSMQKTAEEVRKIMEKRGSIALLRRRIAMKKAADVVVSSAEYTDAPEEGEKPKKGAAKRK